MIRVAAINLEFFKNDISTFNNLFLYDYISCEKKNRIIQYKFEQDTLRSLYAELLVRYIVIKWIGLKNEDITIEKNKYGKPYLYNHPNFQFNISHSGFWIVVAFGNHPVGVDVEKIKEIDLNLIKYFSTEEKIWLESIALYDARLRYFFKLWTLKESFIKAVGKGLYLPLDSFTIKDLDTAPRILGISSSYYYRLLNLKLNKEYELAVCLTNGEAMSQDILFPSIEEIKKIFLEDK